MAPLSSAFRIDAAWFLAAPAPSPTSTPTPSPSPAPPGPVTSEVLTNVAENVLTNLLTVVVLPLVLPAVCLLIGAVWHLLRRDARSWWEGVQDFRRLAGSAGGGTGRWGGALRYWLALLLVLLTGRLSDPSVLDSGIEG